jgi:hypothetical protein
VWTVIHGGGGVVATPQQRNAVGVDRLTGHGAATAGLEAP